MILNSSQQSAVNMDEPQIVVMSGPGSGKTRVAVERVRRLRGRTVILTFTNAAAHEFRGRIAPTIGNLGIEPEFCGTLHSYCFRLIRSYGHLIGYRHGVTLLPENDAAALLKNTKDQLKYRLKGDEQKVLDEYDFMLKTSNLVDYDGILREGLRLLQKEPVRAAMLCDDLIVEESQDSAEIDWKIYRAIPATNRFFIGDVDQAIFEFRSAYPKGLLDLTRNGASKVLKLEQNYRCAKVICDAANRLIKHNESRYEKDTVSATGEEGEILVTGHDDAWQELLHMTRLVTAISQSSATIAILCRTNFEVGRVRDYLRSSTPSLTIYMADERTPKPPDWRRALLLIGLTASPYNEVLAERYLLLDHDPETVKRWKIEAQANGWYLSDRIARRDPYTDGILLYLASQGVGNETVALIESRMKLLDQKGSLSDLLQDLYSNEEFAIKQPKGTVFLGTIHSAKGREFDIVFLPAFEESRMNDENIEEERRLAFVALTRARTGVHISWAERRRAKWGEFVECRRSRFIEEMGL
jgi:superfamily I DNA/RNA helicase